MPAPTAYTEATLKTLMVTELGSTATALGLTTASAQITDAVYAAERLVGAAVADQTDLAKLEAIARWQAWLVAEAMAANQYDLSSSGDSLKRSQWFAHIQSRLARAEAAASRYSEVADALAGAGSVAYVGSVSTSGSPYGWPSDEWS